MQSIHCSSAVIIFRVITRMSNISSWFWLPLPWKFMMLRMFSYTCYTFEYHHVRGISSVDVSSLEKTPVLFISLFRGVLFGFLVEFYWLVQGLYNQTCSMSPLTNQDVQEISPILHSILLTLLLVFFKAPKFSFGSLIYPVFFGCWRFQCYI